MIARPTGTRERAIYAADAAHSAGRAIREPACPMRTPFQRDRDRIVHATAFRRLTYKTQVFVFHEGDHYRTRLTHTLEVAQIARAIARMLALDEDLAEALALAHDLGHPPFGHAGERALHGCMAGYGGFDHNAQSFKVVTKLERKYPQFDGLNLCFETLEGLVKHNGPILSSNGPASASTSIESMSNESGGHGVLLAAIAEAGLTGALNLTEYASAEAQAASIADDIAYSNHDIDDGLRAGLIHLEDLRTVPLVGAFVAGALDHAKIDRNRAIYDVNRRMITAMIADVATETTARIASHQPQDAAAVRAAGRPLVAFSPSLARDLVALKAYLFQHVYRHPRVMTVMAKAETIVADLFHHYMTIPADLPEPRRAAALAASSPARAAMIADFVAGMTDRYAIAEHQRLFDTTPRLG